MIAYFEVPACTHAMGAPTHGPLYLLQLTHSNISFHSNFFPDAIRLAGFLALPLPLPK